MCQVLGIQIDEPRNLPTANNGRCYVCVENITGTDDYKLEREMLNNKRKTKCRKLQIVCKYHMNSICENCKDV